MEKMMNKMEDLKPSDGEVLVYIKCSDVVEFFDVLSISEDGYLYDDNDFNETPSMLGAVGWLPIPKPSTGVLR